MAKKKLNSKKSHYVFDAEALVTAVTGAKDNYTRSKVIGLIRNGSIVITQPTLKEVKAQNQHVYIELKHSRITAKNSAFIKGAFELMVESVELGEELATSAALIKLAIVALAKKTQAKIVTADHRTTAIALPKVAGKFGVVSISVDDFLTEIAKFDRIDD